jgi:hypothetical protein
MSTRRPDGSTHHSQRVSPSLFPALVGMLPACWDLDQASRDTDWLPGIAAARPCSAATRAQYRLNAQTNHSVSAAKPRLQPGRSAISSLCRAHYQAIVITESDRLAAGPHSRSSRPEPLLRGPAAAVGADSMLSARMTSQTGRGDFSNAVRVITDPRLLLPKAHGFSDVVESKRRRIHDRHVPPLNRLVDEINAGRDAHLAPWFDPDGGGINARVLFLLENPGRRATAARGSGLISADNADDTAANFFRLRDQASLPRDRLVAWNVVPWYWSGARAASSPQRRPV